MIPSSHLDPLTTSVDLLEKRLAEGDVEYPKGHYWKTYQCGNQACLGTITFPEKCKDRFCSVCKKKRRYDTRRRIQHIKNNVELSKYESFKILTLTVRNMDSLSEQTDLLLNSFRKLRQTKRWKRDVSGGVYVLEVKMGSQGWHAHLHCILQSRWIDQVKLTKQWTRISGGKSVDLKMLRGDNVISYVTKYISKQSDVSDSREANTVLKGRRLFQPFGTWFALSLTFPRDEYKMNCPHCKQTVVWVHLIHMIEYRRDSG